MRAAASVLPCLAAMVVPLPRRGSQRRRARRDVNNACHGFAVGSGGVAVPFDFLSISPDVCYQSDARIIDRLASA
jgi:hypothetical protein